MRHYRYQLSRQSIFFVLMACSVAALLLPKDMLSPLRALVQPLIYGQVGMRESGLLLSEKISGSNRDDVSAVEYQRVVDANRALVNGLTATRQELASAQATRDALIGLRELGLSERIKLIPVKVGSDDAVPGRDSFLLAGGSFRGISEGDWVVSQSQPLPAVEADATAQKLRTMQQECVLGRVSQVHGLTCRLVLLSDPSMNKAMRVRVASHSGQPIDLVVGGVGQGCMQIPDIPSRLVESGEVRKGSLVTTTGDDPRMPAALVIGEITELVRHRERRLYYNATVMPRVAPDRLHEVYVIHSAELDSHYSAK